MELKETKMAGIGDATIGTEALIVCNASAILTIGEGTNKEYPFDSIVIVQSTNLDGSGSVVTSGVVLQKGVVLTTNKHVLGLQQRHITVSRNIPQDFGGVESFGPQFAPQYGVWKLTGNYVIDQGLSYIALNVETPSCIRQLMPFSTDSDTVQAARVTPFYVNVAPVDPLDLTYSETYSQVIPILQGGSGLQPSTWNTAYFGSVGNDITLGSPVFTTTKVGTATNTDWQFIGLIISQPNGSTSGCTSNTAMVAIPNGLKDLVQIAGVTYDPNGRT